MKRHDYASLVIASGAIMLLAGCGNGGAGSESDRTAVISPTATATLAPPLAPEGRCFVAPVGESHCTGAPFRASQAECCRVAGMIFPPADEVSGWCAADQFDELTGQCRTCRGACEGVPTPTTPPTAPPAPTPTSMSEPTSTPEACDVGHSCPSGRFCEQPAGVCASDLDSGMCVEVPNVCFGADEPVCGCDGLTYGNDCLRRAASMSKSHDGPCPMVECRDACDCYATRSFTTECPLLCPNCGSFWTCEEGYCSEHCGVIPFDGCETLCTTNEQCPAEEYCQKPQGHCDALGACRPRPQQCPDVVDPPHEGRVVREGDPSVCGCDGRTYSNECDAGAAGIAIAYRGPCESDATPIPTPTPMRGPTPTLEACDAGDPCPAGQFCELPVGICASDLDHGTCVGILPLCLDVYEPVCGCDGLTYGNDCLQRGARVQPAQAAPCGTVECGEDCDCYATRTFAIPCPLECANCDNYWTCHEGRCFEHCGFVPSGHCSVRCVGDEQCPERNLP